jgi:hypothetical protein
MISFAKKDNSVAENSVKVKRWVELWLAEFSENNKEDLNLPTVMVSELKCTEEGCTPIETVISLLHSSAGNKSGKIFKPIKDVTHKDTISFLQTLTSTQTEEEANPHK